MMRKLDLTGQRFGRLLVLKPGKVENGMTYSICQCDCGETIEVLNKQLKNGHVQSCGCLKRDNASRLGKRTEKNNICFAQKIAKIKNITHNESNSRLYKIWQIMIQRCENQNNDHWKYYGNKGILVCQDWHIYENFKKWAINNGYSDTLTIDRINSMEGYCPENCRWITRSENSSRAREQYKGFLAENIYTGKSYYFNNLMKFLKECDCPVSYTQAQDIIRRKIKPINGWIFSKK